MSSLAPVMATWTFDVDPPRLEEILGRVKQVLKHLPAVPGWLGTDCFANDARTRVMILSRWESRDAWGSSVWDQQIGDALADFIDLSHDRDFELYFHLAPEAAASPFTAG